MVYKTGVNDRIDTKSDAGTFGYNKTTNHRIDQLTAANGYNPPRHDLTINDEGKTTLITETNSGGIKNKTLTLDYGLDNQRIKTEFTQDGIRKYTRYYFDNYEKEVMADGTVRHLNYIYAGKTLFAIFEQKSGGDKMHHVYTDRQGSLKCITDAAGNIEQRLSFDAWGQPPRLYYRPQAYRCPVGYSHCPYQPRLHRPRACRWSRPYQYERQVLRPRTGCFPKP